MLNNINIIDDWIKFIENEEDVFNDKAKKLRDLHTLAHAKLVKGVDTKVQNIILDQSEDYSSVDNELGGGDMKKDVPTSSKCQCNINLVQSHSACDYTEYLHHSCHREDQTTTNECMCQHNSSVYASTPCCVDDKQNNVFRRETRDNTECYKKCIYSCQRNRPTFSDNDSWPSRRTRDYSHNNITILLHEEPVPVSSKECCYCIRNKSNVSPDYYSFKLKQNVHCLNMDFLNSLCTCNNSNEIESEVQRVSGLRWNSMSDGDRDSQNCWRPPGENVTYLQHHDNTQHDITGSFNNDLKFSLCDMSNLRSVHTIKMQPHGRNLMHNQDPNNGSNVGFERNTSSLYPCRSMNSTRQLSHQNGATTSYTGEQYEADRGDATLKSQCTCMYEMNDFLPLCKSCKQPYSPLSPGAQHQHNSRLQNDYKSNCYNLYTPCPGQFCNDNTPCNLPWRTSNQIQQHKESGKPSIYNETTKLKHTNNSKYLNNISSSCLESYNDPTYHCSNNHF